MTQLRIPQVFVFNIEIGDEFKIFNYDRQITLKCPVCPPEECDTTKHSYKVLGKSLYRINLKSEPNWTVVVPHHQWFDEACRQVISIKQAMWGVWDVEYFMGNKNVFLLRKDLGDGTSETGFAGCVGIANIDSDPRFDEPTHFPEEKYIRLKAFW